MCQLFNLFYTSYDRAKRAGEDEFDRIIHSQLEVIFTKVFMEYKTKYIKPYYTLTDEERNAYSEYNKEIQKTLSNICAEAKSLGISDNQLNGDKFLECSVFPFGDDAKWCQNHEFMGKDMVKRLVDEFKKDENKSYYTCEIDVDSMEVYEGTGFWGDKYKTKWCYSGVNVAARELSKDILDFFSWADINERCEQFVNYLIEDYNKNLEELIEIKIKMIRNIDENSGKKDT